MAPASARAAAERIRGRYTLACQSIAAIGQELIEQKKSLGHGNYLEWVKAEFAFGVTTAHKFTKIAETFGANFQTSENLAFEAWAMLAAPSTPEPVREAVLERAANGEKVTAKQTRGPSRLAAPSHGSLGRICPPCLSFSSGHAWVCFCM